MKPKVQSEIDEIRAIAQQFGHTFDEVMVVYLYGSIVDGFAYDKSDVDIGVVVDEKKLHEDFFTHQLSYAEFFQKGFSRREFDVRIINPAPLPFKYNVLKKGEIIHCRDDDFRVDFEVRILKEFVDFKYYFDQYNEYLIEQLAEEGKF